MNSKAGRIAKKLARRQRRIEKRLQVARETRFERMMSGAPPMLRVARESGLIEVSALEK